MPPTPVSAKSSCASRSRSTAGLRWPIFVDELDYQIRGAYPLLNPYTNRIVGYPGQLGALRRLRLRHALRRAAARAAHRPNRLRQGRQRHAHELRHRTELLKPTPKRALMKHPISYLFGCRRAARGPIAPGRHRSGPDRRRLHRPGGTSQICRCSSARTGSLRRLSSRSSTGSTTPPVEKAKTDADRQRISLQFQQRLTDKQRDVVGPLFQRAQLAIAAVARDAHLSVVVDKRIVIYGGQDITKDVETLFAGPQAIPAPAASPPPSEIGFVDQTVLDSVPKVKTANDQMNQFATTQRALFAPKLAQAKNDAEKRSVLERVQQDDLRQTGPTAQAARGSDQEPRPRTWPARRTCCSSSTAPTSSTEARTSPRMSKMSSIK